MTFISVVENELVVKALKRTTKGSLEKTSTFPGRVSGYWYFPVTVTVSVLQTIIKHNSVHDLNIQRWT